MTSNTDWEKKAYKQERAILCRTHVREKNCECCENTKEALRLLDESKTQLSLAREEGYTQGQVDAFRGKIENLKTLEITETVNVPAVLQDHFREEGARAAVEYVKKNIVPMTHSVDRPEVRKFLKEALTAYKK